MRESLRGTRGRAGKVATPPRARELGRVLHEGQAREARETLVLLVKGGYVGKDFPGAGLRLVAGRRRARSAAGALRRGNDHAIVVLLAPVFIVHLIPVFVARLGQPSRQLGRRGRLGRLDRLDRHIGAIPSESQHRVCRYVRGIHFSLIWNSLVTKLNRSTRAGKWAHFKSNR